MKPSAFDAVYDLNKQVALITGAATGIGLAIAQLFAARGCRLALLDRDARVHATAAALGPTHLAYTCDVSDEASVRQTVANAVQAAGRIDILINNAGIGLLAKAEDTSTELWDTTMAVNLRGPFLLAREAGRHMLARGHGRIVNLASQAATVALDQHLAYCTSKAGLLGMTRVLALEWGGRGITVNAISPTVVETDLARRAWAGELGENFKKKIPTGRFAMPEEIAHAALYLVGAAGGMLNGCNLALDGGYTIA